MQISYLICIFINTDEKIINTDEKNSENKGKLKKASKYKINSIPNCPCCMLLYHQQYNLISHFIQ